MTEILASLWVLQAAALSNREMVDWCFCLPSAVRLPSALNSSAIYAIVIP